MKKHFALVAICAVFIVAMAHATETKSTAKKTSKPVAAQKKKPILQEADENISGQGYGMAGCGLGSILLGDKPGMLQIFAATTNGTFYSQTFGISTGTSNCQTSEDMRRSASLFVVVNKDMLAKDTARGSGEALNTLSELVGCHNQKLFSSKLQQNYQQIFHSNQKSSEESAQAIFEIIRNDHELAKTCMQEKLS